MIPSVKTSPDTQEARHPSDRTAAFGLVAALALCQFMALMDRSLLAVLLTSIKVSFQLTDTQLGLLQGTGFAVLYALAIVPAGLLADRIDRRRLLLCGLAAWSLGILDYALAPDFMWLFAASLLVGLGQAVLLPCALSLITERVTMPHRARATSIFTSAAVAGRAAALIGGGWLLGILTGIVDLSVEPWRLVILTSLVLNLAALVALAGVRDGFDAIREPRLARAVAVRIALRWMANDRWTYGVLLVLLSSTVLAIQGVAAWTPTLLHRRFGYDPAEAALAAGIVTVLAGVAGHAVGGWRTDAAMHVHGLRGAFSVSAVALVLCAPGLLLFTQASDLALSLAGLATFAFMMGAAAPTGLTILQSVTATPAKGTVTGLMLAVTTLAGVGLGPLLIGLSSDRNSVDGEALGSAVLRVVLPVLVTGLAAAMTGNLCAAKRSRPF